jgi:hypothetical protein
MYIYVYIYRYMYMYVYMYAKHMTNICGPIGLKMWLLPLWVHFQPQAYAEFFFVYFRILRKV